MNNARPTVAIIMRSKDEQPHTRPALEGLFNQTWKEFVLYNVDSGSTDGTLEVVKEFNPERVTEIAPVAYVPGKVLNDMTAKTREDIVVFQNADAVPLDDRWLENLLQPILDDEADATMSWQGPRDDAYFVVKYDYARGYDPKNIKGDNADFFSAVACAFKREIWEKQNFIEEGYAEDLNWASKVRAMGYRFKLVQESKIEHSHNYSIKGLYKKKYRHGIAYTIMYGQRPNLPKQIFAWGKEIVRDLLYAIRKLQLQTIPYNIVYRTTIHWAIYRGLCDGVRQQ